MRKPTERARHSFISAFSVIGVIACLCFSVGEGLRLLPIPSSIIKLADLSSDQNTSVEAGAHSWTKFLSGPVSLPVPAQKGAKRQQEPCAIILSQYTKELSAKFFSPLHEGESLSYHSPGDGSPPSGRAPPLSLSLIQQDLQPSSPGTPVSYGAIG